MKTLLVLDKVLAGKRLRKNSKLNMKYAFKSLAGYSEEWPEKGVVFNEWLNSINGLSDETVRLYFRMVRSAAYYMQKNYEFENPFEKRKVESPKVSKKQRRYFSVEELMQILKSCVSRYERLLVMTLLDSACRIGELVDIKGGDIREGFISVRGKTGERVYRLDVRICEALKSLAGGDDKPVFAGVMGKKVTVDALKYYVRKIIKRAGITGKKVGAHTLRHSAASIVAKQTKSVLLVRELLQHDDIETSQIYIHDVERDMVRDVSPLALIGAEVYGVEERELRNMLPYGGEEVAVADSGVSVVEEVESIVNEYDVINDMFVQVPEGVKVRPLLGDKELVLLRDIMVGYARVYRGDSRIYRCEELMRRMLRKVGCREVVAGVVG